MACGSFGGCSGGSGINGKGRTPYTPQKSSSTIWDSANRSTGASRTAGKASEIGSPKIRMSFRSRTSK